MKRPCRLLFVVAFALCLTRPGFAQSWKLVWSDEFNGPTGSLPSAFDWNVVEGWGPNSNHEIQWYCLTGSNDGPCDAKNPNLYEDGAGHLVVKAIHADQRWSSGRLNTQGKHALLYGRVEARIRMDPGAGFWPAFWLLGDDLRAVGWPGCGEQDIMEWVQKYGPTTTSSTVHGPGYSGAHGISREFTFPAAHGAPGRIDTGFHTYGMTWSKDRIEFYRDDPAKPYFAVTPESLPQGTKWVFDHPFFVILNFAVEKPASRSVDATTPAPAVCGSTTYAFISSSERLTSGCLNCKPHCVRTTLTIDDDVAPFRLPSHLGIGVNVTNTVMLIPPPQQIRI